MLTDIGFVVLGTVAVLGGAAVFGDRLGRREWLGVGLVVLGVVVVHGGS